MRAFAVAALIVSAAIPGVAFAQTAPAPATVPAAGYSVETSEIGTLLDDPAARAVLDKHVPGFSSRDQIGAVRGMTLKAVQQYAPDVLTDKVLANIDYDLSKLTPKK